MLKKMLFILVCFLVVACNDSNLANDENNRAEDMEGGIAEIIRNPVTADQEEVDTSNVAKIFFAEPIYEFSGVDAGAVVTHDFTFTNEGEVPLIISDVRSTCGCTVADWPKAPIAPGSGGVIPVRFDTKNKSGRQNKPITITANTIPAKTVIYINGQVDGESS